MIAYRSPVRLTLALFPLALAACPGPTLDDLGLQQGNPRGDAPDTPVRIKSFAVSPESFKVDKVGGTDGAIHPDGTMDAAFALDVSGTFVAAFLVTTDPKGNPDGVGQWDTLTANQDMPPALRGLVKSGGMTGGIGFFENGQVANQPDGSMARTLGEHRFQLYVPTLGVLEHGMHVQLVLERPDREVVRSQIVTL